MASLNASMLQSHWSCPKGTVISRSGSIRSPPGPTTSGIADTFCATTGTPQASDSARVSPNPSPLLVDTNRSKAL